jgi:hypothetical protein
MRPTALRSLWPAMPTTIVAKIRGAMIDLIMRMKIKLSGRSWAPISGKIVPMSRPRPIPIKM